MGKHEQLYRNPDHDNRATPQQQAWAAEQERLRQEAAAKKEAKEARDAYEDELYDEFQELGPEEDTKTGSA